MGHDARRPASRGSFEKVDPQRFFCFPCSNAHHYTRVLQRFHVYNTFANIMRDLSFWHSTTDLRAKLVLGAPRRNAKHQLGEVDSLLEIT